MRPLLLDLYCGAGGAAMGYYRAGFDVVGVDKAPQPNYPFAVYRHDALDFLRTIINSRASSNPWAQPWKMLKAVHASPPCQASCTLIKGNQRATANNHVDLIPQTRELLAELGLPSVIENVQGAKVRRDLTLCGEMFGLDVIRHRYFECSFPVDQPPHKAHRGRVAGYRHGEWFDGPYFAVYGDGGGKGTVAQWQQAMGIDWTDVRKEIAEAIPPAYTEFIGAQLLDAIEVAA
ncbi:DNA cytosine methyltransferase [Mycolicibacterium boenickei]|nr:DNA cytosine methyltransferase [Mycolicibacterium boenickei]